jgi:hypothetical protein
MKPFPILAFLICSTAFASAPELLIPAAGSTPGVNGTFFRSDITIGNFATHDQIVRLRWLPQGVSSTFSMTMTLRGRSGVRSEDFVTEILGQSGLGAILITGVTSSGGLDPTADLYAQSRIWTPQPGTNGTTSQSLPAIPTSSINQSGAGVFSLGSRSGNFRTNMGIVNLDANNAQTFSIIFPVGPLPFAITVTVPPMSMQQAALGGGAFQGFEFMIVNQTDTSTRSNSWVAYGSTIDNVTGDAWSELGVGDAPDINGPLPIGKDSQ